MNKNLQKKINESFSSVLPITIIVLLLSVFVVPVSTDAIIMFLMGAVLLVVGMGFFTLGADMAMMPMGEGIGRELGKSKAFITVVTVFIMGGWW